MDKKQKNAIFKGKTKEKIQNRKKRRIVKTGLLVEQHRKTL